MNNKHLISVRYNPTIVKAKPVVNPYLNPVGVWRVTTEGDVEGRTTKDLGIWQGHVCNIAFQLAHKAYYTLGFRAAQFGDSHIKLPEFIDTKSKSVHIFMDIDTQTWNLSSKDRVRWFKNFLNLDDSSNVEVKESNYYACVLLELKSTI